MSEMIGSNIKKTIPGGFSRRFGPHSAVNPRRQPSVEDIRKAANDALARRGVLQDPYGWQDSIGAFGKRDR